MIKVKLLNKDAKVMTKAHTGDAGFDVYCMHDFVVPAKDFVTIPLGLAVEFEPGQALTVNDKSGLAVKKGIFTIGGIIDSGYRGEIHVCLANFSVLDVPFKKGDKVSQLILIKCDTSKDVEVVEEFTEEITDRGTGGFGSTGR